LGISAKLLGGGGKTDPGDVARGELQEETLVAARMVHAGHLFEAYGYSNQGYHIYAATGLQHGRSSS
jgi:ADP-ribose pyrophosphatase